MKGADLSRLNLKADLYKVDLSGANLSGADLSGANMSGANMRNVYPMKTVIYEVNEKINFVNLPDHESIENWEYRMIQEYSYHFEIIN